MQFFIKCLNSGTILKCLSCVKLNALYKLYKTFSAFCLLLGLPTVAVAEYPTVHPTFSSVTFNAGWVWCDAAWPNSCFPTASSVEELVSDVKSMSAAYSRKHNVEDPWASCAYTIIEYSLQKTGGFDTSDSGHWGVVHGNSCGLKINYNGTSQCPYGYTYAWHPWRNCKPNLVAVVIPDEPPPQLCAGNPISVANGAKVQVEEDIPSLGVGQVYLTRYYGNSNRKVKPLWRNNYSKSITPIDLSTTDSFIYKSQNWDSIEGACNVGWNDIGSAFPSGSVVSFLDGKCNVFKNGVIIKTLPIALNTTSVGTTSNSPLPPLHPPAAVKLNLADGSAYTFQYINDNLYSSLEGQPSLERPNINGIMWRFKTMDGELNEFSSTGKLVAITSPKGIKQTLTYDTVSGLLTKVQDSVGTSLTFGYTEAQIASVTANNKTTNYTYNAAGLIIDVKRSDNTHRKYHYEDSRFPNYLTGISDERGVRYATWAYDAQGRAISSEHAGGAEKTTLAFNTDGSTTVTNALNKQTIYRFDDIAGARRVVKVEGQATTNCVGANQNYTYTREGWIASKTDWNGNKTTFTYNSKGQEISRTEASGSAVAKTITTEWHATLDLKTKVTEPGKETVYTYDAEGLLLTQNTRSLL